MVDFLDSLPAPAARKVTWVLKLVEDLEVISRQYFKKLAGTGDIWECRIRFGSIHYRVFGFFATDALVLTHGISKQSAKTPAKEIARAQQCKLRYWEGGR